MEKPELKDLLKPPFWLRGWGIHNSADELLYKVTLVCDKGTKRKTCNEAIKYLVDALNEKAARDLAEPKRWKHENLEMVCPECDAEIWEGEEGLNLVKFNHCPNCGVRLLPLEEELCKRK